MQPACALHAGVAQRTGRVVVHRDGVDAEGQLGGDLFAFAAGQSGQAAGMNLLIQDANRVAAAGQFRVIDAPLNTGTAQARISYKAPTFEGPTSLLGDLALAQTPQTATVGVNMSVNQPFASLGLVALGTQDLSLTLNNPGEGQSEPSSSLSRHKSPAVVLRPHVVAPGHQSRHGGPGLLVLAVRRKGEPGLVQADWPPGYWLRCGTYSDHRALCTTAGLAPYCGQQLRLQFAAVVVVPCHRD